MSVSIMGYNILARLTDAEKKDEITEITSIIFLIEEIPYAFEIHKFRE